HTRCYRDWSSECALPICAVTTGLGAVFNTARVRAGRTAAVIGCGGIGLSVVQGCRIAGARRIVAVDTVAWKVELAVRLGATDAEIGRASCRGRGESWGGR